MQRSEIVISIPHAGTHIPPVVRRLIPLSDETLLHEPDLYTDRIYTVPGTRLVKSKFSRVISDPNRAPDEIYTEGHMRAQGVVMLSQSHGLDTFEKDPDLDTMEEWVKQFHTPFHDALNQQLQGAAFLIDGHSMWSSGPPSSSAPGIRRADIVLGNREYSACSAETTKFFRSFFEECGYQVAVNNPFSGRYIIGSYANRFRIPGIQIEIKRSLYLDEETLEANEEAILELNRKIDRLLDAFCTWSNTHTVKHVTDLSGHTAA